ncbi:serine hydrolase [Streptomyces sp. NPDC101237]|uniref:serine hydrolase n=1 Tax=Streptomyces sp. NPDC101237 TaxID=3366139 RepID=UPI003802E18D
MNVLARVDRTDGPPLMARIGTRTADFSAPAPVPWNAHFRVARTTKTFVASAVLQLVAGKRLSLDDTVGQWLPGVVTGNGNDGGRITVRDLLRRTSGLYELHRRPRAPTAWGRAESRSPAAASTTPTRATGRASTPAPR